MDDMLHDTTADGTIGRTPRATRREWVGLAVLALPCLLYSMDLTVLYLAVPHLSADLRPTSGQLLWIVDIYGFLLAGFLITMGTLGDRIGRRRLLMIGAAAFGTASVLAAFAPTAELLIAARALLGIAAATLAPSTLSLIRNMFHDRRQRTFAIGVWIASFSAGGAIGPLVGGVLLEFFWWGSVFLAAVPVMLVLLVVGPILLPEFREDRPGRIDLASALLSLAAVLAMIYGLKRFAVDGFAWPPAVVLLAGIGLAAAFVHRQRGLADPLIDIRLFRSPGFSASLFLLILGLFIAFGAFLFVAQYLQLVLGMSPLEAGLWTAPTGIAMVAGSMAVPQMVRHVPPAALIAGGFLTAAVGLGMLTQVGGDGLGLLIGGAILFSVGLAPIATLATDLVVGAAPPERAGAAAAISETTAEFGGALGIAVLGSLVTAIYRTAMAGGVPPGVPEAAAAAAHDTLGGAVDAASGLAAETGLRLLASARAAYVQAFEATAWLCVGIALVACVAVVVLYRRVPRGAA